MQFTIKAMLICYWKLITCYYAGHDDGFSFGDRTTICTDSASVTISGKFDVTDSTVVVYHPGMTKTYYWYNCPSK
jgi:hypothetical protein